MATKQTFSASCPVTGEVATRTSSHPYAGSVTIVARRVADYTDELLPGTKPSVTVRTRGPARVVVRLPSLT